MAGSQANVEKDSDCSLLPIPLGIYSKSSWPTEEQHVSFEISSRVEHDGSSSTAHLRSNTSPAIFTHPLRPVPPNISSIRPVNLTSPPHVQPEDEMEKLREIFRGRFASDKAETRKHPAVDPLASALEARKESSLSGTRTRTIDSKEKLPKSNFTHISDMKFDIASRKNVEKDCLKEKEQVVKKISVLESDRAAWTSYIVNYAKGKYDVSDPLDPSTHELKLSDKMPFFPPPTPLNEFERVRALRRLGPFPTQIESYMLQNLANRIEFPNLTVSMIDRYLEIRIASTRLETRPFIARERSFACHAILGKGVMEVCDLTKDWRFRNHPHVIRDPKFKYFAAVPIMASGEVKGTTNEESPEFAVGALTIYDQEPRKPLGTAKRLELQQFASTVLQRLLNPNPPSPKPLTDYDSEMEQMVGEQGTDEDDQEDLCGEQDPNAIYITETTTVEVESRRSSVVYLPSNSDPQEITRSRTNQTRNIATSHARHVDIAPSLTPGNASPEIRFVAHEFAVRLQWDLLYLMRLAPINIHGIDDDVLQSSNYTVDVMAAFGFGEVLTDRPFAPHPVIHVQALRSNLGVIYNGTLHQLDADDMVNAVIGVLAPVRRENWSPRLELAQCAQAKGDRCLDGVVIAGYKMGLPTLEYMQSRDEVTEMLALQEAGELMYQMLCEFRPGTDYDPGVFQARLEEKDEYFEGFQLVGDDDFMF